jgi:hypothetical protein
MNASLRDCWCAKCSEIPSSVSVIKRANGHALLHNMFSFMQYVQQTLEITEFSGKFERHIVGLAAMRMLIPKVTRSVDSLMVVLKVTRSVDSLMFVLKVTRSVD